MRRAAPVAGLLGVLTVAQAAAVVSRLGDGHHVSLRPDTERVVSDELLSTGRVVRATIHPERFRPPAQALYGEAGRDDPLEGPMLAVGSGFHDNVPVFPTAKTPGFRTLDLDGRTVAVGRDRAWTWVTWDLPDCTDECQGYTAGRNLSEEEVLAAARGATADRSAPRIADGALPAGVSLLLTVPLHMDGLISAGDQIVSWREEGGGAVLAVARDPRVAVAYRFWIDRGPARIRGQTGAAGSMARLGEGGGGRLQGRAWSEGGRALLLLTSSRSGDQIDRFVRGLRTADAGEWDRLRSRVLDIDSDTMIEDCYTPGEPFTAVGRHEGRFRWAVGFRAGRQNQVATCEVILTPDRRSHSSGGGPRPAPGALSVSTLGIGGATDPIGLFVMGGVPAGATAVRVHVADGHTVDAELAGVGPSPGERYYAVFVEGDIRRKPAVVALDRSGAELARVPGGAPT